MERHRRVAATLSAALVLTACGGTEVEAGSARALEDRAFSAGSVTEDEVERRLLGPLVVETEASDDALMIRWNAGCNSAGGHFEVDGGQLEPHRTADGDPAFDGTEMGCDPELHEQDRWLERFFGSTPAWDLDSETLTLRTADASITLQERDPARRQ